MPSMTATTYEIIPAGSYDAVFDDCEEKMRNDGSGSFFSWHFTVTGKKGKTASLTANSSTNFGPKSNARKWAEGLIGRKFEAGENFDTDALKGTACRVILSVEDKDDGTQRNVLVSIAPAGNDTDEAF